MPETLVTTKDNGGTVSLAAGDVLVLQLPENPTTGFRWVLKQDTEDAVRQRDSRFNPSAGSRPGAGGEHVWRFDAARAGSAHLQLTLERSWGAGASSPQRFELDVNVVAAK